jgi:hypothetical protein
MPSALVEKILADYRKNPSPCLELSSKLSDVDFAALTTAADTFAPVEELKVSYGLDTSWFSSRFLSLAIRLPKLSRLNASSSHGLSDAFLEAIAERLTNLNMLHLGSCWQVTDVGVQAIAQHLTNLKTLQFRSGDRVTDAGVQAIAQRLTSLNELRLNECNQVTDAGVQAIAQHLTNLKTLDLGSCDRVTDAGVQAIAQHLTNLTYCSTDVRGEPRSERLGRVVPCFQRRSFLASATHVRDRVVMGLMYPVEARTISGVN